MSIKILRSGPMTTVQDHGRYGYLKYGIGNSGVMDQKSYEFANMLVGNKNNEAVLEATLMGPEILFENEGVCAVSGAFMNPMLDGEAIENNKAYIVHAGTVLSMGFAKSGCRSYIALAGGISVEDVMGSKSTNLKCQIGGLQGRKLQNGDVLPTGNMTQNAETILKKSRKVKIEEQKYASHIVVDVVLGPQNDYFTESGLATFINTAYTVTTECDRMGIRLEGEEIESINGVDIVSDGIAFGSIQITNSGKPIILMADHQTTGGYAKIATVCAYDLPKLAQVTPGTEIRFHNVTVEEATDNYRAYRDNMKKHYNEVFKSNGIIGVIKKWIMHY